ncbi:hypothetical protein LSAT2_018760, partial [Lamellibrachia satsuma]
MTSSSQLAPSSVRLTSSRVRVLPRPEQPKRASTLPYSYENYPHLDGNYGPHDKTDADVVVASYLAECDYDITTADTALVCPCCVVSNGEQVEQDEHQGNHEEETHPDQQQSQQLLLKPKRHLRKPQQRIQQPQQQLHHPQRQLQQPQQQLKQPQQQLHEPQQQLQQPQQQLHQPQQQLQEPYDPLILQQEEEEQLESDSTDTEYREQL